MKRLFSFIGIFFFTIIVAPAVLGQIYAGYLNFDQTSVSVANGGTFNLGVIVNAGSDQINGSDVYVTYDSSLLEAQSISAGTFFPTVTNNITSGRVYIAGMVDQPATSKTGSGTIATITFRALKEGTGTISFDCSTSTIVKNDINATNMINCNQNGTAAVTVGAGSGGGGGGGGGGTVPTSLPQTGFFDNARNFGTVGAILLFVGVVLKLVIF